MGRQASKRTLFRIADAVGMPFNARWRVHDLADRLIEHCKKLRADRDELERAARRAGGPHL